MIAGIDVLARVLQPLAERREPEGQFIAADDFEDGLRAARMFGADKAEDLVAHGLVGHQAGIERRDVHVGLEQRLFRLVYDQLEGHRVGHQVPQRGDAVAGNGLLERRAHAIPAGDHVPVLAPREHPRNGAQVVKAAGAKPAGGPRADLEQRQFLDRAGGLEIGQEARPFEQVAIGPERGA